MPAGSHATLPLPGLSPVAGKPIIARFDGGSLSSDGGLLALREVENRLGLARRLADMLRFRLLMIAAGYEHGNDADSLRHVPLFELPSSIRQQVDAAVRDQMAVPALWSSLTGTRTRKRGDRRRRCTRGRSRVMVGMAANPLVPNRPAAIGPAAGLKASAEATTPHPPPGSRNATLHHMYRQCC